mgnify:CR=1 FL=1
MIIFHQFILSFVPFFSWTSKILRRKEPQVRAMPVVEHTILKLLRMLMPIQTFKGWSKFEFNKSWKWYSFLTMICTFLNRCSNWWNRDTSNELRYEQKGGKLKAATEREDFFRKTYYLTSRSFTNMRRDLSYYWFRLLTYVGLAIVLGTIYYKVGLGYSAIQVILALRRSFRKAHIFCIKKLIFLMIKRYIT